jgi:hypothetical protein
MLKLGLHLAHRIVDNHEVCVLQAATAMISNIITNYCVISSKNIAVRSRLSGILLTRKVIIWTTTSHLKYTIQIHVYHTNTT